jgi:hypothetical protein
LIIHTKFLKQGQNNWMKLAWKFILEKFGCSTDYRSSKLRHVTQTATFIICQIVSLFIIRRDEQASMECNFFVHRTKHTFFLCTKLIQWCAPIGDTRAHANDVNNIICKFYMEKYNKLSSHHNNVICMIIPAESLRFRTDCLLGFISGFMRQTRTKLIPLFESAWKFLLWMENWFFILAIYGLWKTSGQNNFFTFSEFLFSRKVFFSINPGLSRLTFCCALSLVLCAQ